MATPVGQAGLTCFNGCRSLSHIHGAIAARLDHRTTRSGAAYASLRFKGAIAGLDVTGEDQAGRAALGTIASSDASARQF